MRTKIAALSGVVALAATTGVLLAATSASGYQCPAPLNGGPTTVGKVTIGCGVGPIVPGCDPGPCDPTAAPPRD